MKFNRKPGERSRLRALLFPGFVFDEVAGMNDVYPAVRRSEIDSDGMPVKR